jgi:hypothetical protein
MIEDVFGLALEREGETVERALGLVTPGSIPADELPIVEACYRLQAHPACHNIIFTEVDEETGEEVFENSDQWAAILGFPRPPTVAECLEWANYHDAKVAAVVWFTLEEYRAKRAASPISGKPKAVRVTAVRQSDASARSVRVLRRSQDEHSVTTCLT